MAPLPELPLLMLVTEAKQCLLHVVRESLKGGVNVVQFRHRSLEPISFGDFLPIWEATTKANALLVLNFSIAFPAHIYGLHIPESWEEASASKHRECFAQVTVVGRSVHSVERAVWAAEDGADYLLAGTIYPSNSHPGEPGQGVGFLREVCAAVAPLPVIAIGGITPERVGECIAAGAAGVAVLSPIMRADDPQAVARTYREALDTAWKQRNE